MEAIELFFESFDQENKTQYKSTTFHFYNDVLPKLSKNYRTIKNYIPVLSIEKLDIIDSNVPPLIISLGLYLKRFHEKIKLITPQRIKTIKYLEHIGFFNIIRKEKIFDYDELELDKYKNMSVYKELNEYRDKHKLYSSYTDDKYYEIKDKEEREKYREDIFRTLKNYVTPKAFSEVLSDKNLFPPGLELDEIMNKISEVLCNAIIYSMSELVVCNMQTNKYRTAISISDIGIGFAESIKKKNDYNFSILEEYKKMNFEHIKEFTDFFILMDILNYSRLAKRRNLFSIRNDVIKVGGTMRIHYNSCQVVFSTKKCEYCASLESDLRFCTECLLKFMSSERRVSSLRQYDVIFPGVHIEIELQGKKNGGDNNDFKNIYK